MSLICNWFDDWGRTIQRALGQEWIIVLFAAFLFISLCCLAAILRASIGKTKLVFKWGIIILFIISTLLAVWACYLMATF